VSAADGSREIGRDFSRQRANYTHAWTERDGPPAEIRADGKISDALKIIPWPKRRNMYVLCLFGFSVARRTRFFYASHIVLCYVLFSRSQPAFGLRCLKNRENRIRPNRIDWIKSLSHTHRLNTWLKCLENRPAGIIRFTDVLPDYSGRPTEPGFIEISICPSNPNESSRVI